MPPRTTGQRDPLRTIDLLKVVAAQCIVLHHFSAYGPLSEAVASVLPTLSAWLYNDARMAVQVFLVVGGFLAARSLGLARTSLGAALSMLVSRYRRLVVPFAAALALTIWASALARPYLAGDLVPAPPTAGQLLAHAALLHSVLDVAALSAGVWYVAIDFQLYAVLVVLLGLAQGRRGVATALAGALCAAALLVFNRDAQWDAWALYFFGAYGLGVLAAWATVPSQLGLSGKVAYCVAVGVAMLALVLDFRERIALALAVSLVLVVVGHWRYRLPGGMDRVVERLSHSSYALFLLHFAVLLLANALWAALGGGSGTAAVLLVLASWGVAVLVSLVFHQLIEQHLLHWLSGQAPRRTQ